MTTGAEVSIAEEFPNLVKDLWSNFPFVLVLSDEGMPHDISQLHSFFGVLLADT